MNVTNDRVERYLEDQGIDVESGHSQEERTTMIQMFRNNIADIAKVSTATGCLTTIVLSGVLLGNYDENAMVLIGSVMAVISAKAIEGTGITAVLSSAREQFTLKNIATTIVGLTMFFTGFSASEPELPIPGAFCGVIIYGIATGTEKKMISALTAGVALGLVKRVFTVYKGEAPLLSCVTAIGTLAVTKFALDFMEKMVKRKLA